MSDPTPSPHRTPGQQRRRAALADASLGEGPEWHDPARPHLREPVQGPYDCSRCRALTFHPTPVGEDEENGETLHACPNCADNAREVAR